MYHYSLVINFLICHIAIWDMSVQSYELHESSCVECGIWCVILDSPAIIKCFVQIIHNINGYLQLLDIFSLGNKPRYLFSCKCSQRHFLFLLDLKHEDSITKVNAYSLDSALTLDLDDDAI